MPTQIDNNINNTNSQGRNGKETNLILEAMARARLTGRQFQVLCLLLRQTHGYKRSSDQLNSDFLKGHLPMPWDEIKRIISQLNRYNIITVNNSNGYKSYVLNMPDRWDSSLFGPRQAKRPKRPLILTAPSSEAKPLLLTGGDAVNNNGKTVNNNGDAVNNNGKTVNNNGFQLPSKVIVNNKVKVNSSLFPLGNRLALKRELKEGRLKKPPKPFQQEAVDFLAAVEKHENIRFANRAKLIHHARLALATTNATSDKLVQWYLEKRKENFWTKVEPPFLICKASDMFPTWFKNNKESNRGGFSETGLDPATKAKLDSWKPYASAISEAPRSLPKGKRAGQGTSQMGRDPPTSQQP